MTDLATAILDCAAQVLPVPVQSAAALQAWKGDSVQFFGGLAAKLRRLPRWRRDSRSSVSSPEGGGWRSAKLAAQAFVSTAQVVWVVLQVQLVFTVLQRV